jgi:curved DNA-binding protein CbpA
MNMRDPYLILKVSREANDEAIHQAYLQAIRECPPEHDAQRFQAVRHAYETLRTEKLRLEYELFNTDLPSTADLLQQGLSGEQKTSRPNLKAFQDLLKTGAKIAAKTKPTDQ